MKSFRAPHSAVLFAVLASFLYGCSTSSPRFKSRTDRKSEGTEEPRHGPRFTSHEAEEETKENDRQPDPKEVEKITSGARDFKKEKNPAITPLDQSKMMREISKYMGVPYLHGGTTMDGLDCSGYTMLVYQNAVGQRLPRSSVEQSKLGRPASFEGLKFGDLIFFNTTGEPASHVGIYLGDDLFAHASVSLGVTISSLESAYFKKRFETARRVID